MTKRATTRIVVCPSCDIRTRHEWQQWEQQPLLFRITGHIQLVEGWVCNKCGRKSHVRSLGVTRASAHS